MPPNADAILQWVIPISYVLIYLQAAVTACITRDILRQVLVLSLEVSQKLYIVEGLGKIMQLTVKQYSVERRTTKVPLREIYRVT
jgi:hypothetical protein